MATKNNSKPNQRARDAIDGKFIPLEQAKTKPNTTVIETIKNPCRDPKKK